MKKYHKIETVHLRDEKTHKLTENFRNKKVEYLKDNEWIFTEKIDGTNIRVLWDGHTFTFAGRTDKAQIPKPLFQRLTDMFLNDEMEQVFEQKFGENNVMLYGEGYGVKIQNGGAYSDTQEFILFDVEINGVYLDKENVNDIASSLGLNVVPIIDVGYFNDIQTAVEYIKTNPQSQLGKKDMEGVVGVPKVRLFDENGDRLIVKIKTKDYKER